ncbi:sigma-70 family RNA polymerase sigma factor [Streptomyces sp. WAC 06738]|uniref:sigma-70 family RNA polymerase sigma factor n=1 Tax=Streptomyces sp. WAC 06738 TaxID=2203210 RepID=UPI0013DEC167|nr:sigma-70 family RNA polymerase sigma factor [Streptomyces sp. WAC 06738]
MHETTTGSAVSEAAESDAELTRLVRTGPSPAAEAALDELYRRHRGPVLAYARSCTQDWHTAEDLVSEAFTRALHALQGGRGPEGAWRPYLLTTVRRTAADWSRTARRAKLAPDFEAWLTQARVTENGEEHVLHRENADLVLRAFRSLPERWQTALWHTAVEGEPPDRIAPLLGLSPSGVRSLTARAREGLRQAYLEAHVEDTAASEECRHYSGMLAGSIRRAGRRRREHRALERHLAGCFRCRRAGLQLQDLNSSLKAVLPVGILLWAGASYGAKPAAAASGGAVAGGATGLSSAVKAGMLGASVFVVALGAYMFFPDRGQPSTPPPNPSAAPSTSAPTPTPEQDETADPTPPPRTASPTSTPSPRSASPTAEAPPSWQPAADDRARLPIASTGRCMDISAAEGAEPYEAECDGGRSQQWELLVDRAGQQARIRNYATGMCLTHTGTETDGAPVRQQRSACHSGAETARWAYFTKGDGTVAFALPGASLYLLGLDDWHAAGEGEPHAPDIGTTANYYDTPSLRFRYAGNAFGG